MVENNSNKRKQLYNKLRDTYKTQGGHHKAKFLKVIDKLVEDGILDKSFYGKFKDKKGEISDISIKEALDADPI